MSDLPDLPASDARGSDDILPPPGFENPLLKEDGKELTLSDIMKELRVGHQNADRQFSELLSKVAKMEVEFSEMKADMVTKGYFEELKSRVLKLEEGNNLGKSSDMKSLRFQLDRLDPANKSLAFSGFTDDNLQERMKSLEDHFRKLKEFPVVSNFETVHKAKKEVRKPTKVTLVEFKSNSDRERALSLLQNKDLKDSTGSVMTVKRAKIAFQRER